MYELYSRNCKKKPSLAKEWTETEIEYFSVTAITKTNAGKELNNQTLSLDLEMEKICWFQNPWFLTQN